MSKDLALNLVPGQVIAQRFEIIRCLGIGGFSVVYLCHHLELARKLVVVKVLIGEIVESAQALTRLANEVVTCYRVNHQNVVKAYDYFQDDAFVGYAREYVDGDDLRDKLSLADQISFIETIDILTQICAAVSAIHQAGVIHRDLKPENILFAADGTIKVTDFGISLRAKERRITGKGDLLGTIGYLSPEYLEHGTIGVASDIYAIGVIAFEMLTKRLPFVGPSLVSTMMAHVLQDPPAPTAFRPTVPKELDAIVLRALAKNPANRYQSVAEIGQDLQNFVLAKTVDLPSVPLRMAV